MGQDKQVVDIAWTDNSTITFTKKTEYKVGGYTVNMTSKDITLNSSATSVKTEVAENKATKIEIDTTPISAKDNVHVGYKVLDSYGNPMKIAASSVQWAVTSTNTAVDVGAIGTYEDYITVANAGALEGGKDKLRINAYLKTDMAVNTGLVEVPVEVLVIQTLTFTGVVDNEGKEVNMAYNGDTDVTYYLTYTAVDNFGNPVDVTSNKYGNLAQFKTTITSSNTNIMNNPVFETKTNSPDATDYTGRIKAVVKQGKSGSVVVTAMGYDYKPTNQTFVIKDKKVPVKVIIGDGKDYDIVANDTDLVGIPVSFEDQYGEKYTLASGEKFSDFFNAVLNDVNGGNIVSNIKYTSIVTDASNTAMAYNNGKFYVSGQKKDAEPVQAGSVSLIITPKNDVTKQFTYALKVKEGRSANQILLNDGNAVPASLLTNQTKDVRFDICDAYSKVYTTKTNLAIGVEVEGTGVEVKQKTAPSTYAAITNKRIDMNNVSSGLFTLQFVGGAAATTTAPIVKISLLDVTNAEAPKTLWTSDYKIPVTNELAGFKIVPQANEYKAGEDVNLTISALKTSDPSSDVITNYNQKMTVVISEGSGAKFTRVLEFKNGVATTTVTATTKTDAVKYIINAETNNIARPSGLALTSGSWSSSDVKIVNGEAAKLVVAYSGANLTVTVKDSKNNAVPNWTPADTRVKIATVNKKADGTDKDPASVFINKVDTDNNLLVTASFDENGQHTFTVNNVTLDSGDSITVTINGITGTYTVE